MVPRRRGRRPWRRRRAYRLARTAVLTAVLVTVGMRCEGHRDHGAPQRAAGPRAAATATAGTDGAQGAEGDGPDGGGSGGVDGERSGPRDGTAPAAPPPRPLPRSPAVSLRIPSLGIDAPVTGIGLDADRQLQTPPVDKPKLVGWYRGGPTPGETGTALAVGHRDTRTGPAVFAALGQLPPGRRIEVRRADGRTAVYTVDKVRVFDKARFPDKEVYGPARRPELHVITCGGLYTRRTGYSSNVVVFAHLTSTK
ncbi:class F sortase [Streptomyces sp. NRRL S-340]|uniref:class F sortase n=1 Tax=Streptomyces sp. NRRL S-340 TaxID=1463901 RepID=UPI0005681EB9|nr:class F sortase [Streptomyces sp. NRRL S-340]